MDQLIDAVPEITCDKDIEGAVYAICGSSSSSCETIAPSMPDLVIQLGGGVFTLPGLAYTFDYEYAPYLDYKCTIAIDQTTDPLETQLGSAFLNNFIVQQDYTAKTMEFAVNAYAPE